MTVRTITTLLGAAAIAIAVATAAPARADDQSFLADLRDHGVPIITSPAQMIGGGYTVCAEMRNGMSPEIGAQQWGVLNGWGPVIVDAAQHELCPDTLG